VPNINDPSFDEPRLRTMFRFTDAVDYHEGEQPPDQE
jgi:hypothetical protein